MPVCKRQHDMERQVAFICGGVLVHTRDLTRNFSLRIGHGPRRRYALVAHPRHARILPTCSASDQNQDSGSADQAEQPTEPSRTLIGRIVVEILSLMVGAVLLLTVVMWRAFQVVSRSLWRSFVWLSNIRQLGKWAVGRVVNAEGIAMPISSLRKLVSKVYGSTVSGISTAREENLNQAVVQRNPAQEEQASDITVGASVPLEPNGEESAADTNVDTTGEETIETRVASGRRLILLRHAKTTWDRDSEIPDRDRVLSAKGKEEARLVGHELAKTSWLPDVVLCSDAVRTVQTLSLLDIPDRDPASITCTEALYYAVTGDEMAVAVDDTLGDEGFIDNTTLMVVCHNPGCEELVEQLTGHRPDMGTGCAALLEYAYKSEPGLEYELQSMRLSPQRKRWTLARVIRPISLSSPDS